MDASDKNIRTVTAILLRVGVYLSMAIVIFGGIVYLYQHGSENVDYSVFYKDKVQYKTITAVFSNLFTSNAIVVIQFGLLMLIFTPIARVILAAIGFALERDYLYVLIGFIILIIIASSLSAGFVH